MALSKQNSQNRTKCTNEKNRRLVRDFYGRANSTLQAFGYFTPDVKYYLFDVYCCSFYGLMSCSMRSDNFSALCIAWNKVVRRIFHLPYRTHTNLLGPIIGKPHIKFSLYSNFIGFAYFSLLSDNPIIRCLSANSCCDNRTIMGGNLSLVLSGSAITPSNFVRMSLHDIRVLQGRTKQVVGIVGRVAFIRQILNSLSQACRDKDVLLSILEYLCCQ